MGDSQAMGPVGGPAELLKLACVGRGAPGILHYLYSIITTVWTPGEVLQDTWKDATIYVLYKEGRSGCCKHRWISLLARAGKHLCKIVVNRVGSFSKEVGILSKKTVWIPAPTIVHQHDVRGTPTTVLGRASYILSNMCCILRG